MTDTLKRRSCELAVYIIENNATVRKTATHFGVSKSTVHKDISQRLLHYNKDLYIAARNVLEANKAQRHIRGGLATKEKYKRCRNGEV